MKSLSIILLIIAFSSISSKTETVYKCASELKIDTCSLDYTVKTETETTVTHYVDGCGKGKTCQYQSSPAYAQCVKVKYLSLEGDKCTVPSECLSGNCNQGKCAYTEDGGECTSDKQCKVGSYCNTSEDKCAKYLAKDADCSASGVKCRPGLTCANSKCVINYSLDNGEVSEEDTGCKSGESYDGKCGVVKSVTACSEGAPTSSAIITFTSDETTPCDCQTDSETYSCKYLQGILDKQKVLKEYIEAFTDEVEDILDDDDYLEYVKIFQDSDTFGIKKLKEKWIEYDQAEEISQAPTDDDKDCVRDYYISKLGSNKLYFNLFGIVLSILALL